MTNYETSDQHPVWEGAIVGFLAAVETGLIPPDAIITEMSGVYMDLVTQGLLTDPGELQRYLRTNQSPIQMVALVFRPEQISLPGVECVDILTGEPRGHYLSITTDIKTTRLESSTLIMSDEVNETALTRDTGVLVIPT